MIYDPRYLESDGKTKWSTPLWHFLVPKLRHAHKGVIQNGNTRQKTTLNRGCDFIKTGCNDYQVVICV